MNSRIILLAGILFWAIFHVNICGQAQDNDKKKKEPTGDIIVIARSCDTLPYQYGLRLGLNKMGQPGKSQPDSSWKPRLYIGKWVYDSVLNAMVNTEACIFNDQRIAKGVTDSLGRFIFKAIPVGCYQIICAGYSDDTREREISDSLYAQYTDFPTWDYKPLHYPKNESGYDQSHCEMGVVDDIRIAPDSISIVKVRMFQTAPHEVSINYVNEWHGEIRPRNPADKK
jgi:hypothetical protein